MSGITEFRKQNPQYNDVPDDVLVDKLHKKFYSDMDKAEFSAKFMSGSPAKPKQDKGNWYDGIRAGLQGGTLGISDEIGAGVAAGVAKLTGDDRSYGDIYGDIHDTLGHERDQYKEANPGKALAAEVAGGILTGGVGGAKVLGSKAAQQAGKNIPQWAKLAGVGATEGGVYGAASADRGERLKGGATGFAVGGVAAPVAGAAGNAIAKTVGPILQRVKQELTYTPSSQALQVLRKHAEDAGLTVEDVVEQYKKLGDDGILADADENFRGLMRALSDKSGPAKREARKVIEGRQVGSVDRLIDKAQTVTGKDASEYSSTVKAIKEAREAKAAPLYQQSWSAEPSEEMLNLVKSRKSLGPALARGKRLAADEGEDISKSSFRQFHYAKMALDDKIRAAKRRAGGSNEVRVLTILKKDLLGAMDKASEEYGKARALFAGDSELLDAAESGSKLFKMRPDEIDDMVAAMGQSEKELFRHGAIKAIVDKLEDSQLTHDNASKLVNSKSMQRKLGNVFDSPDQAKAFISQAIKEREFTRTRNVVTGGPSTSQNLAMGESLDNAAQAFAMADGGASNVITGVLNWLRAKPITPQAIDEAGRILLDKGLTPDQIREIFTRSRIIEGAKTATNNAGRAAAVGIAPASVGASNHL